MRKSMNVCDECKCLKDVCARMYWYVLYIGVIRVQCSLAARIFLSMYRRKLFVDVVKYVQVHTKFSYVISSICRSSSRNAFVDCPSKTLVGASTDHYNGHNKYKKQNMKNHLMLSGGILLGLFDLWKSKEEEDIPELIMTLKRSILLIQRGEYNKAEQMLHIALMQAQTLQHYEGITYTYDLMANLAFDTKDYKKAETLFVSVLQRLISTGTPQNDLKVIHISLKMAKLFEETGDKEKAEQGYKYCLEELQNHRAKDNEDEDVLALLGMTQDWFAHMLLSQSKYADALKYLSEAYEICVKLNGEVHEQSVVLLNDLGTVHYMMGQYDVAMEHLSKAAKTGQSLVDMVEFGSIHVNLGNVFLKKGMFDEARKSCLKGELIARAREDEKSLIEAEKCLRLVKEYLASIKK